MKKGLLAGLVIAAALFIAPSAFASSNYCSAPDRCTTSTAEDHVDLATVRLGRATRGAFALTCTQGSHSTTVRGRLGYGAHRLIATPYKDCTLVATGKAPGPRNARVRVALG